MQAGAGATRGRRPPDAFFDPTSQKSWVQGAADCSRGVAVHRTPVPLEIDRRQVDKTLSRFRVQGAAPRSDVCVTAPLERRRRRWGSKLASTVPAAPHHSTKCSNLKVNLQHCRRVQQHCRRAHRFLRSERSSKCAFSQSVHSYRPGWTCRRRWRKRKAVGRAAPAPPTASGRRVASASRRLWTCRCVQQ